MISELISEFQQKKSYDLLIQQIWTLAPEAGISGMDK